MLKLLSILVLLNLSFTFSNELVVFIGDDHGSLDFQKNVLPEIKKMTAQDKISLKVIDDLPSDVKFTPSLYFQNYKGRSLYLGRYNNLKKIKKFITTTKIIPQTSQIATIENTHVLSKLNYNLFVRLKITDFSGVIEQGFDQSKFKKRIQQILTQKFNLIKFKSLIEQKTGDRTFYFDIYPWKSKNGDMALSLAIYSQFDCHNPVFSTKTSLNGKIESLDTLVSSAAQLLETELLNILSSSPQGDALNIIKEISHKKWSEIGLSLPKKPEGIKDIDPSKLKVVQKWKYSKKVNDSKTPAVFFNFPAPLDHYQGQILDSDAHLVLNDRNEFVNVTGLGVVDTTSLDMGDDSLNDTARSSISALEFKKASLEIIKLNFIDSINKGLVPGQIFPIIGQGRFKMKNLSSDVVLKGEAGVILNAQSQLRLFISLKYRVNIKSPFGISGPDSSVEANNLMDYQVLMEMEPVKSN